MIKKIVVFSMMALMAVASLTACGGGGGGNDSPAVVDPTHPTTGNVRSVAPTDTVTGVSGTAEQFNIVNTTAAGQERTISGFVYGEDHIAVPSTLALTSAPLTAGDTTSVDSVDLVGIVNGFTTTIHMTKLSLASKAQLQANSDYTKIFTIY